MIWVSDGNTIKQGMPIKYFNWNDGLPFNYRSWRVYMAQEDQPTLAAFRIHPANETGQSQPTSTSYHLANIFLDYRVQNGRYSEVPAIEYTNNNWAAYSVCNDGNKFAPNIFPRSQATGIYSPYLTRFLNSATGSFKSDRNGIWTTTFTKDTHQHFYPSFIFYGIFLFTNKNRTPQVKPDKLNMLAFSNTTDAYSSGTWISSAGTVDLDISATEYGTPVEYGETIIDGVSQHYTVYIVRHPPAKSYRADNLILNTGLSELSMPFISFKNAVDGDNVYFLEYGFHIEYKYY